jgi:phospholipid/cholesterol/gamma-HCH transport system ATP-binding protein
MTAATQPSVVPGREAHIVVRDLDLAFGDFVLMRNLGFTVCRGDVFVIMGGSGCGKSTLMRTMVGLLEPARGEVLYRGTSFTAAPPEEREVMLRRMGVLFQQGALWSSLTLAENIALPLQQYTKLPAAEVAALVELKLALVGLRGFGDYYPAAISGGMRKRAGLARAMALDPEILFFDEPSAGLDPISSKLLDDLILALRDSLGATIVLVTHELASIFAIASNGVFLDTESRTMVATGSPREMLESCSNRNVQTFLRRGGTAPEPGVPFTVSEAQGSHE